jgi:hypothetical protein
MKINPLPAGFVVPAQPVKASRPPVGTDWVHEIKHDGYQIIVRRDGRLFDTFDKDVSGVFAVQHRGRCYVQDLQIRNAPLRRLRAGANRY